MNESVKKIVGSERPHHYGGQTYKVTYYNSNPAVFVESRVHNLIICSSADEPKHLNDIAVRKAKEHNWQWTSFLVYNLDGQIVSKRVARKPKK